MNPTTSAPVEDLTRPIIGIENRTAQEVFDIMSDRIRGAERTRLALGEGAKAVGWLRKWSNGQPSEGLVKRQNLSERDIEMMCVALAAAADTIEQRLSAAPVQAGEKGES